MESHLARLVHVGLIDKDEAQKWSNNPKSFLDAIKRDQQQLQPEHEKDADSNF
jgi:hypothetical protein